MASHDLPRTLVAEISSLIADYSSRSDITNYASKNSIAPNSTIAARSMVDTDMM